MAQLFYVVNVVNNVMYGIKSTTFEAAYLTSNAVADFSKN